MERGGSADRRCNRAGDQCLSLSSGNIEVQPDRKKAVVTGNKNLCCQAASDTGARNGIHTACMHPDRALGTGGVIITDLPFRIREEADVGEKPDPKRNNRYH